MRTIINLNNDWAFTKQIDASYSTIDPQWEKVNLPHTWNAIDGQDGGSDYYRGKCLYAKTINKRELPASENYYLEVLAANSSADVYLNATQIAHHDGGYSIWRVDLSDKLLDGENILTIVVDNAPNPMVYPQMADFTFYGGLYRGVNLIAVPKAHFDLDYYGGPGIKVTPIIDGDDAKVTVETFINEPILNKQVKITITDAEGQLVCESKEKATAEFRITNVHKWHGRKDPYLYQAKAELYEDDTLLDVISTRFGCRSYEIDAEKGFILNGEEYPLRGVSRHQDRLGIGNALLPIHHQEDMDLICEVGATTIRLAHYQHDQYFYDLCDEKGMVVWAEIPYISQQLPSGNDNTISQMKELISQNYNHPSIVVWGLSNEITMKGADDPELLANHQKLNDLCHTMDPTRLTTMAVVSMCPMDAKYLEIPDVVSWNHYFGWYGGETDMNGPWFDRFHAMHPKMPVGCSEYGCEALNWHNSTPHQGDYTEEYQAYYHEELIKQLFPRKYLWATHVWNMFDFGADSRNEGGENGQNHKGLVTFDRKYKKDSFYAYKAWLSNEPFVHICSKRYVDRVEDITKVTIYSNQEEVELFANDVSLGKKKADDHFFRFEVKLDGEVNLKAVAGTCEDSSYIRKVAEPNPDYILCEKGAILNWFDVTEPAGRLSLNSPISQILASWRGKLLLASTASKLVPKKKDNAMGFELTPDMMKMIGSFSILRLIGLMGMATDMMGSNGNELLTKEGLLKLNKKLNRIKAPTKKTSK